MSEYELNKKIRPAYVSVRLLQEIEKYLHDQAESQRQNGSKITYIVSIFDKYGEERIDSFENYHRLTLPDEATRIILSIFDSHTNFSLLVSFGRESLYSHLGIKMTGNSAKEKSIGIANTIDSRLKEYSNISALIIHSWIRYLIPPLLGIGFGITFSPMRDKVDQFATFVSGGCITAAAIYILLFIAAPYSIFDSNRNKALLARAKWVLNGLAGVFVFGLGAAILRKYLLGY